MKRYLTILITALILGALLLGYGKVSIKGEDGETTTIDYEKIKDGKMNIEVNDKDGEKGSLNVDANDVGTTSMKMNTGDQEFDMVTGENTEVPEGFPKDFPIPSDAEIEMTSTITEDTRISYMVNFTFNGNNHDVYEAVKEYTKKKGMESDLDNQRETDGMKSFMYSAGIFGGEYFTFNVGLFEENNARVTYHVPN